jgi:dachs protein
LSTLQRTGLLSMLDVECSVRGFPETYVQKVKVQHKDNRKLFEPKHCDVSRTFGIQHYAGQVCFLVLLFNPLTQITKAFF